MRYSLLTLLPNFVAVADQRKRDASPVPHQKRYPEETHSQSSSDRQLQPPGEPSLPKSMFQSSVSTEKAACPATVYVVYWPAFNILFHPLTIYFRE